MKLEIEIDTDDYSFPDTPKDLREYAATLRNPGCKHTVAAQLFSDLTDQWEAKLPKPRMAEPAWGEKVIARGHKLHPTREVWLIRTNHECESRRGVVGTWDDLVDPVPFTPEAAAALS